MNRTPPILAALVALGTVGATHAMAETAGAEDPMAEAQAILTAPTSLAQAIATAEQAAGGKVAGIEYQAGENGMPAMILADVMLADGSEKTVAVNPADGKVLNITLAANDQQGEDGEEDGETAND